MLAFASVALEVQFFSTGLVVNCHLAINKGYESPPHTELSIFWPK